MQFRLAQLATLLPALTGHLAAADSIYIPGQCTHFGVCSLNHLDSKWRYNDGIEWNGLDSNHGCRSTGPFGDGSEFCMDWTYHRGHFRFPWEQWKRCLGNEHREYRSCDNYPDCFWVVLNEVQCEWRVGGAAGTENGTGTAADVPGIAPEKRVVVPPQATGLYLTEPEADVAKDE
jgi:hypothetical protein